jgi:hypothetical protein
VSDHQGQGLSGEWAGDGAAPVASACRALSARERAEDAAPSAGQLSPLPAGRWLPAVTRVFGTASADQRG